MKDCKAHIIAHPDQVQEKDTSTDNGGKLRACSALAVLVSTPVYEECFGDTGASFRLTNSLRCMKYPTPPVGYSVTGIGGIACNVSIKGNLTVVLVTDSDEYVAELLLEEKSERN